MRVRVIYMYACVSLSLSLSNKISELTNTDVLINCNGEGYLLLIDGIYIKDFVFESNAK